MKRALTIVGILLALGGGVWILQGVGLLPGSFMSGQIRWAYNGVGMAALGLMLVALVNRPRRPPNNN